MLPVYFWGGGWKKKNPFGPSAFIYTSFFFFQLSNINKMTSAFSRGNWRIQQTEEPGHRSGESGGKIERQERPRWRKENERPHGQKWLLLTHWDGEKTVHYQQGAMTVMIKSDTEWGDKRTRWQRKRAAPSRWKRETAHWERQNQHTGSTLSSRITFGLKCSN